MSNGIKQSTRGFRALWFFGVGWAISANVPRVYEPVVRARRLQTAIAVTERRVAEGTFAVLRQQAGAALAPLIEASAVTEANVP